MTDPLLDVRELSVSYPISQGTFIQREVGRVHALNRVSLTVNRGESVGLVGESGCGKSTLARAIVGLVQPASGEILLEGRDLNRARGRSAREHRRRLQMIFQDPYDSLDPRMTIGDIVAEGLDIHGLASGEQRRTRVLESLDQVHLPRNVIRRYPRALSGGQRQRVAIARALAVEPIALVLDEPLSGLDVSVQAQIIKVLNELRQRENLTFLFITHDLSVVPRLCDRLAVMYLGKIVEIGSVESVLGAPRHPYTEALLSAVPVPDPDKEAARDRILLTGDVPSPSEPPTGCVFYSRCPYRGDPRCESEEPALRQVSSDHWVATFCEIEGAPTPAGEYARTPE